MALLKFLKGNYSSLSTKDITEGQVLICGDTGEMFVDIAADKRVKIGDFVVVSNIQALEALDATVVPTSRLYYVEDGNILARSNGTGWTQINKQKTLAELGGVSSTTYATDKAALLKADTDNATAISNLEALVGTIPTDATAKNVVAYVQERTSGIATDTALEELSGRVDTAEGKLATLTGADTVEGSVAKALKDAKTYADGLNTAMDTRMNSAEGSITTLTGEESVTGSVKAIAKSYADSKNTAIQAAQAKADSAYDLAEGKTTMAEVEAKGYATKTEAQGYANAKDEAITAAKQAGDNAQADVDALEGKVGTVPEGKTVVQMIAEAQSNATYDDTQIKADIKANADAIKAHKDSIDGVVSTLVGEDAGKSVRTIANEELAAQLIPEGAKESLNTLQEIAAWIQDHPDDASAMNQAITGLEALVGTLPEDVTATTIADYVAELVTAEESRAKGVESGLNTRLEAVETKLGDGEGSVSSQIDTAKQAAINAAAVDATTKANAAEAAAKAHADGLVADGSAIDLRIDALEAATHTHDNKALLDTYTQTEANLADAVAKKHEHANKAELDKIADGDKAKWDAVVADHLVAADKTELEGKITAAQTAAEGKVTELTNGAVKSNAEAIAVINGDANTAGSIAKALSDAKAYTDALKNGQVETNKTDIALLFDQLTWGSF